MFYGVQMSIERGSIRSIADQNSARPSHVSLKIEDHDEAKSPSPTRCDVLSGDIKMNGKTSDSDLIYINCSGI